MEHHDKTYCLEVRGDFACFTRPEMKVERVSYEVMTPSAARAVFEAIFWKPAIRWEVRKIEVLNPIQWANVRRNEVGAVMGGETGLFVEDLRQQRAGLLLKEVAYRLHATLVYVPPGARVEPRRLTPAALVEPTESPAQAGPENPAKYQAMFERRARKGQCFNQPYLGCREFSVASFRLVEALGAEPIPIPEDRDLGFMLYDLDYAAAGGPTPAFFRARMQQGVVAVPDWDSPEVRR
jgi:CRISPR-associated protein Cas5d